MQDQKWQFWIDRGGTFTDIVAHTPTGKAESEKQWIDEMIKRNLSVDKFNQEFNQEDWSLSISEGRYMMKNDDKGNQEEYSGTVLELHNRQKQYAVAMTKYDPKNPYIPKEIYEEMVLW